MKKHTRGSVWLVTKSDGTKVTVPAKKSKPGRVGPGAVAKAKARERQLERDLSTARQEHLQKAVGGEFGVRAVVGERVERLTVAKASEAVEPETAVILDPPLHKRGSKQIPERVELEERRSLAKEIVLGPVVENGRTRPRSEVASGGRYPGSDIGKLN